MSIYLLTDGSTFGNLKDLYSSPETNLPIVLSFLNYVKLIVPSELKKISGDSSSIIVFLPDNLLKYYANARKITSYIFVLATHKKPVELGIGVELLHNLAIRGRLFFQSEIQRFCYQEWFKIPTESKNFVFPIYTLDSQMYERLGSVTTQFQTGKSEITVQNRLLVMDQKNPFSVHLTDRFEKLGFNCTFWDPKRSIEIIRSAYILIITAKLTGFPYLVLPFMEKGVPFISVDFLYGNSKPELSLKMCFKLDFGSQYGGEIIRHELWDDVCSRFELINKDYRNYVNNARKQFEYLYQEYSNVNQYILSYILQSGSGSFLGHESKKGLKISKLALRIIRQANNQLTTEDVIKNLMITNTVNTDTNTNVKITDKRLKPNVNNERNHTGLLPHRNNVVIQKAVKNSLFRPIRKKN